MKKTIKELADELNISKQAIQKRLDKLPTNQQPTKVSGRYILTENHIKYIYSIYKKTSNQPTTKQQPIIENVVDNSLSQVVEDLKNDKIELFESVKRKDKQIEQLQKLLDQQQVLTLQANKKIEQLELQQEEKETDVEQQIKGLKSELEVTKEEVKKGFWQRLFKG